MSSFLTTDSIDQTPLDQTPLFVCYDTQSQMFNTSQKICTTLERIADEQHDAYATEVNPLISECNSLNINILKIVAFGLNIGIRANACRRDEIDTRAILNLAIADCRATIALMMERSGELKDRISDLTEIHNSYPYPCTLCYEN